MVLALVALMVLPFLAAAEVAVLAVLPPVVAVAVVLPEMAGAILLEAGVLEFRMSCPMFPEVPVVCSSPMLPEVANVNSLDFFAQLETNRCSYD